jgi:hypothetical protein
METAFHPKYLLLRRLLGPLRKFARNVGKHSLEYFASGLIGVFLRRPLRLGFFAFSGRFEVGRLQFLSTHRDLTEIP